MRSVLALLGFLGLVAAAAAFGTRFTIAAIPLWYAGLIKPAWNPPAWLFGPVWTVLYVMMAVAAWLVWRKAGLSGGRLALSLFLIQLALNAAWSWLFFGLRSPAAGLADIIALWLAIAATMAAFRPLSPLAFWLMTPYLAWVTFAGVLNLTLWRLNP